jgi:hypothetical protein
MPEVKSHLGDLGVDGRIILKWILNNSDVGMASGFNLITIRVLMDAVMNLRDT